MAEARNCAAPGGVRSTTRLALASAETSSSASDPGQPGPARRSAAASGRRQPAGTPPGRDPARRLARQRVHQRAARAAQPDRAELLQVAGQRGLGDLDAALGQQLGQFAPATGPRLRARMPAILRLPRPSWSAG